MKLKDKEYEQMIQDLKSVASEKGIKLRFEKGDFGGGYCILKEDQVIVINKITPIQRKAIILATALKEIGVEDIYINPKIRELIEES